MNKSYSNSSSLIPPFSLMSSPHTHLHMRAYTHTHTKATPASTSSPLLLNTCSEPDNQLTPHSLESVLLPSPQAVAGTHTLMLLVLIVAV